MSQHLTNQILLFQYRKILGFPYNQMQKLSQKFTLDKWDDCMKVNPKLLSFNLISKSFIPADSTWNTPFVLPVANNSYVDLSFSNSGLLMS